MANKIDIQSITKLFLTHKTAKNTNKFSAEEDHVSNIETLIIFRK